MHVGWVLRLLCGSDPLSFSHHIHLKPDFRPPDTPATGPFDPYAHCVDGFNAIVEAVSARFRVNVISWGNPVWQLLARQSLEIRRPLGVCVRIRLQDAFGRPLELPCGKVIDEWSTDTPRSSIISSKCL
jgi:hypothetical protein